MIKSPIDLITGSVRFFNRADISPMIVTNLLRRLGQDLLDPPNVKGWAGATAWVTTQTMAIRDNFLHKIARGLRMNGGKRMGQMDENRMESIKTELNGETAERTLLPIPAVNRDEINTRKPDQLILDPAFHLK